MLVILLFIIIIIVFSSKREVIKYSYYSFDGSNKIVSKNTYYPETLEQVINIIKKTNGRNIRVSGGSHTFNDISISRDIIIRTSRLNKILRLNKTKKQITVESGIILLKLNNYLEKNGLALSTLPAIPYQTIGGAISTSTHGSRSNFGSMSSMIISMTMVLYNGNVVNVNNDHKYFKALKTSIGCLGFIYSITLQCEDLFAIKHLSKKIKIDKFINNFKGLQDKNEFLQAYLWDEKNTCTVYYRKKINLQPSDYKNIKNLSKNNTKTNRIDFSHKILTKNMEISMYTEMEIAIPIVYFKKAINDILEITKKYKNNGYNTTYSILVRFTSPDNSLIGMTSGRDSFFVDVFNKAEKRDDQLLNKYFKELHDYLINNYNGRPHYGKKHYLTKEQMKKIYGSNLDEFIRIKKIMDPKGVFSNDYIKRIIN